MSTLNISSVSYLNSLPFSFGLEGAKIITDYNLSLDIPSRSIDKILRKEIDIGLVPVAALNEIEGYKVISDFCIGAEGPVNSVMLYSEVELSNITDITLDYQSKTSNLLLQYLAQNSWQINPKYKLGESGYERSISGTSAGLVIGDRALELNGRFKYTYDLAEEWKKYTHLPFVFACWIAKDDIADVVVNDFNNSLKWGMENLDQLIHKLTLREDIELTKSELEKYFTQFVSYSFGSQKKEGLALFKDFMDKMQHGMVDV